MKELDAEAVKNLVDSGAAVIVDVREQDEYDEAHIEGVHFLPMSTFNPHDVPQLKEGQTLVFQCLAGGRSARMMEVYEAFFPDVECFNFKGGIKAWIDAGFPVVRG